MLQHYHPSRRQHLEEGITELHGGTPSFSKLPNSTLAPLLFFQHYQTPQTQPSFFQITHLQSGILLSYKLPISTVAPLFQN
jgi:hypothetical protein